MKNQKQKSFRLSILIVCLALLSAAAAPADKKVITLDDMKTWRESSVSLSDDGKWFTVIYSLLEIPPTENKDAGKPAQKETAKTDQEKERKQRDVDLYGEKSRTDVLYVRSSDSDREFAIDRGAKPLFSPCSQWIAYDIMPQESSRQTRPAGSPQPPPARDSEGAAAGEKEPLKTIELRHLPGGETYAWPSNAAFRFAESAPYFLSYDKSDLLLFNLESRKEQYIGSVGEFLLDKKSSYLLYTIDAKNKRGNGVYLYDLKTQTTRALDSEGCYYGNLAWNGDRSSFSAVKFQKTKEGEPTDIRLFICRNVKSEVPVVSEYKTADIKGLPNMMRWDVEPAPSNAAPGWSQDNQRLFVRLRKAAPAPKPEDPSAKAGTEEATVDVWHGQDKKLVSQQMVESQSETGKRYLAIFIPATKTLVPLTGPDMQTIDWALDTDRWAVGGDDRAYISDWDIRKRDLYRIDLRSGERTLICEAYPGGYHLSPDGERALLWREGQYWDYEFRTNLQHGLSAPAGISFRDAEYDQWGSDPDYGFVGWVKGQQSVIVNHRFDLWRLFVDGRTPAVNLTAGAQEGKSVRFRFCDFRSSQNPEPEERSIDLARPNLLLAFDPLSKEAGYYQLRGREIIPLIYKPASFSVSGRWRPSDLLRAKKSDTILFRQGTFDEFPEAYLSDIRFTSPRRMTSTNPQQDRYKWGRRILIDYQNDEGVPLQGILSIPDGTQPGQRLPMIVYSYEKLSQNFHQYPSLRISGSSVSEMMYLSDDYLFLQPDIHFRVGTPHSDMHECIAAAIREVIRLGYVDEKRIGYEGFSFGGHCGMYISTQKNLFAAIAAGAGVSNLVQGFTIDIVGDGSNEQDYYMTQQGRLGAPPSAKLDMYLHESAVFQAQTMETPLLLFHGTADTVVQWEHSFGLYSILRFLKKPVIFLSYKGEGHGLRKLANRLDIQQRLKEFFDYHLKGKPAPVWISTGQPFQPKTGKDKEKDAQAPKMWK